MTLGIYEYDAFDDSPYPNMARVVFVLFQILIPILLLNMLIAMMGNTYGIVIESAEKEFLKAWAKVYTYIFWDHLNLDFLILRKHPNLYSITMKHLWSLTTTKMFNGNILF